MTMTKQDIEFNNACDAFTVACQRAAHWKHNYFGARYSNRIVPAIIDLEAAIAAVKTNPEIAEKFNDRAMGQLATVQQTLRES